MELKKGAPTDILLLNITLEKRGYMVPSKIVKLSVNINILFNEMAPSRETKFICNLLEKVLFLFRKRKKLIAEIASNNKRINTPLVGSFAKA